MIVGAGPSGALLAIFLARRGFQVHAVERRPDPRKDPGEDAGRSINLGLSQRGIQALRAVGLVDALWELTVPMRGRVIHTPSGGLRFQPYGTREHEILQSIRRRDLIGLLLDRAESYPNVELEFDTRFVRLDGDGVVIRAEHGPAGAERRVAAEMTVGADGVFSAVREQMRRDLPGDFHSERLEWGYKEMTIPPASDGGARVELRALHVWPGGTGLIVAHPNQDGSLTCTLLLPLEGPDSFASLTTPEATRALFRKRFPDTLALLPNLTAELAASPLGQLVSVRTAPWHAGGRVVLVGDAVHGTYPFYGQGMNAAFEDCRVLDECVARHPGDLAAAFREYQRRRKPHTDVLDELNKRNFVELRDRLRSPLHRARARVDLALHKLFPRAWVPLYTLVSHTATPYADALRRARRQDALLAGAGAALAAGTAVAATAAAARRRVRAGREQPGREQPGREQRAGGSR